jgi:uncharacterized membrane protein
VLGIITAYGVGKFIHVFAVIVAFGPTYAYPFMGAISAKTDPRAVPTIHRIIAAIDRYLLMPGLVILTLAGFYLVSKGKIQLSEAYVSVGIAGVLIVGAMQGMFFSKWNREALALAESDLKSGDTLGPEYMALTKKIAGAGQFVGILIAVVVFFMVVKP